MAWQMQGKNSAKTYKIPIVYVIDNFYRGGGTENQLAILIDHLDRNRFTPYVFNLRPKWKSTSIEIGCEVFYLNLSGLLSFNAIKAFWRIFRFLRKIRAEILQVYFMDSRIIGTLAGKLAGVKRIVFCRREMGWAVTPAKLFAFRLMGRMSHYSIVNAHCIKEMVIEKEKFPAERIEVIYNGCVPKHGSAGSEINRRYFNIPESAPVIGHISNLRPVKRIDRLIRIAAALNDRTSHFLIIGEGDLLDKLRAQAESLGVGQRIHFFHTVEGIDAILGMIDIGVLTSESEGLSNVLIEYALAGIPAIAFDAGGNSEIIDSGQTGFIIPDGDEKAMAEKMDFLLENRAEISRLGGNAVLAAREKFGVSTMVKKTEGFYLKILK